MTQEKCHYIEKSCITCTTNKYNLKKLKILIKNIIKSNMRANEFRINFSMQKTIIIIKSLFLLLLFYLTSKNVVAMFFVHSVNYILLVQIDTTIYIVYFYIYHPSIEILIKFI